MEGLGHWERIPFTGVWREQIFWDLAANTLLGNVFLLWFSSGNFWEDFWTLHGEIPSQQG